MKIKNNNYMKIVSVITFIGIIIAQSNITSFRSLDFQIVINDNLIIIDKPLVAGDHDPILINGNAELASFIANEGLSGAGTKGSPYIIEDFTINASTAHGIDIRNTDAYLIIQNCTVENGNSSGYYGIKLNNIMNLISSNNSIIDNVYGIELRSSSNITFSENKVFNNNVGIVLVISNNNTLSRNNVFNNNMGIHLVDSSNNTLSGNNANNNEFQGIEIAESNLNILSGNNANNNKNGIKLLETSNNTLSGNNVSYNEDSGICLNYDSNNNILCQNIVCYNNEHGITLDDCIKNTVFGNNVSYNDDYGICLDHSSNNTIYFNDIYNNQNGQAIEDEDSTNNQWDNGTIGNYWGSDYWIKYPDVKNDGTYWDIPYEINGDGSGIDNFPLVNPILDYEVPEEKKISGFPFVSILFFISIGAFLLKRRIIHQRIRK